MITVLVTLVLLALSGLLALRATFRIERTTATIEALRPAGWRVACAEVERATDELVRQLGRRIDG